VAIPVAKAKKKVNLNLKGKTLADAIRSLGLVLSIPAEGPVKKKQKRVAGIFVYLIL